MSTEFCSIEEAVAELKAGRMVVLVDDEQRENEGDLIHPRPDGDAGETSTS